MTERYAPEIAANLARAEESVQAARVLVAAGHFDFAASRAYYAAFYAATAALLAEGLEFSKHSGVIATTHQTLVKTGRLEASYGRTLNRLFELRNIGDYGETRHVPPDTAAQAIEAAAAFVHAIKALLGRD
jgi:uncharacterized protein (UPF0332 family)